MNRVTKGSWGKRNAVIKAPHNDGQSTLERATTKLHIAKWIFLSFNQSLGNVHPLRLSLCEMQSKILQPGHKSKSRIDFEERKPK